MDYIKSYGLEEQHKHVVLLITILVKHKEEILRKLCGNNVYPLLTSSLLDYCNEDILLYHIFFNDCYQVSYSKKLDEFAMKHHKRLGNYLVGFK